jgi:hypothetical protein
VVLVFQITISSNKIGTTLAVGCADLNIYIYSKEDVIGSVDDGTMKKSQRKRSSKASLRGGSYLRKAVCRGHRMPVYQIDFALDSRYFQSSAGLPKGRNNKGEKQPREMVFWTTDGKQVYVCVCVCVWLQNSMISPDSLFYFGI